MKHEREEEIPALQFLTVLCFLQLLMARSYMVENPKGSDICDESPLCLLRHACLPHARTTLDQCPYGATIDGGPILKSTDIEADQPLPLLNQHCDGTNQT